MHDGLIAIHHDIKPFNIVVKLNHDADGAILDEDSVLLIDFGTLDLMQEGLRHRA